MKSALQENGTVEYTDASSTRTEKQHKQEGKMERKLGINSSKETTRCQR